MNDDIYDGYMSDTSYLTNKQKHELNLAQMTAHPFTTKLVVFETVSPIQEYCPALYKYYKNKGIEL